MGRRLRQARQVRYAPTVDGAAVLGPSGIVALRGASVYAWLERLWRCLMGRRTWTRLWSNCPPSNGASR